MLNVDLVARATRHGRLDEGGVDAQVLGKAHRRLGVTDPVDVGQRQAGVAQRVEDHGHLEVTAEAVELSGG